MTFHPDRTDPAPFGEPDPHDRACEACGAEPGEECRPLCIGLAAHLEALPLGDS